MVHRIRFLCVFVLPVVLAACSRSCARGKASTSGASGSGEGGEGSVGSVEDGSTLADQSTASTASSGQPERRPIAWSEPLWACDGEPAVRARPCSFVPDGKLVRASGFTTSGPARLGCERVTVSAGDRLRLSFQQSGTIRYSADNTVEEGAWQVRCMPGRLEIFWRDALVPLSYEDDEFDVDALWTDKLVFDSRLGWRTLSETEMILLAIRAPEMRKGAEALLRIRLLMIERALRAQNRDKAELVQSRIGAVSEFRALEPWVIDVKSRLESLDDQAPIRVGMIQELGTIPSEPVLPFEENEPTLFWRAGQLCVREEVEADTAAPSMKCASPRRGMWGRLEPYSSPFADGWKMAWEPSSVLDDGSKRKLVSIGPDGARVELGEITKPTLVARAPGNSFAAVSSPDPEANEPVQTLGLEEFDVSASAGTRVTARNCYFERPDRLRSFTKAGTYWNLLPIEPSAGSLECKTMPLVSPDQRWAACTRAGVGADAGPPYPLIAFELQRTPNRKP